MCGGNGCPRTNEASGLVALIGRLPSFLRSNRFARVLDDDTVRMQEVSTGYGFASGQPAICRFGLSDTEDIDLRVDLPNGQRNQRTGLPSTASS